jgi:2-(1,2-epoxy-1,2-dihydrophenyl)acetyl-CoA isomerase
MYQHLLVDNTANTLRIRLNRSDVLNALTLELLTELKDALTNGAVNPDIRAVLLTGEGRGFCAGADLAINLLNQNVEEIVRNYYNPVIHLLATMPKPTLAAINGIAAGAGMSLALACDYRLISDKAALTVGFTKIGLSLDAGMSYFLPRLVGRGRAFELAYSNRTLNAQEALQLNIVETILPNEDFTDASFAVAKNLALGPASFAYAKQLFNYTGSLEEQLGLEATLQAKAAKTSDASEGINAFAEKRKAIFKNQ